MSEALATFDAYLALVSLLVQLLYSSFPTIISCYNAFHRCATSNIGIKIDMLSMSKSCLLNGKFSNLLWIFHHVASCKVGFCAGVHRSILVGNWSHSVDNNVWGETWSQENVSNSEIHPSKVPEHTLLSTWFSAISCYLSIHMCRMYRFSPDTWRE